MHMYSTAELVINYLRFYWKASNSKGHGVHSPFVFDFINEVLQDTSIDPSFEKWKGWRYDLLHSREKIQLEEIGAGSRADSTRPNFPTTSSTSGILPTSISICPTTFLLNSTPECGIEVGISK